MNLERTQMRNTIKAALVAFGAMGALAGTASAQSYDEGYYGDPAYGDPYAQAYADPSFDPTYGYCDPTYGCPDDYYDLPLYYGDVFYDGSWLTGPFYYRDYGGGRPVLALGGRRQFWAHGGWREGRYRGGRFGPALGRNFYAQRGFSGRNFRSGGNWGGQNYARRSYNGNFGNAWNNNRGSFGGSGNAWNNTRGGYGGGG